MSVLQMLIEIFYNFGARHTRISHRLYKDTSIPTSLAIQFYPIIAGN